MPLKPEKLRILIVDDNSLIRDLIRSFYKEYAFELLEAANGEEAVAIARACIPDLIVLDLQMPVLNGYQAACILKQDEALRSIPILVITGQDPGELEHRIGGMYDGYVRKPFQKAELIKATLVCLLSRYHQ